MKTNVEINEKYFERESHRSYQPVGEPPATPLAFLRCYCSGCAGFLRDEPARPNSIGPGDYR